MADYNSTHAGTQLDAAIEAAMSPDNIVREGSTKLVTSGAVHNAMGKQKEDADMQLQRVKETPVIWFGADEIVGGEAPAYSIGGATKGLAVIGNDGIKTFSALNYAASRHALVVSAKPLKDKVEDSEKKLSELEHEVLGGRSILSFDLNDASNWELGSVDAKSGDLIDKAATQYIRTKRLKFTDDSAFTPLRKDEGYNPVASVFIYDASGGYIDYAATTIAAAIAKAKSLGKVADSYIVRFGYSAVTVRSVSEVLSKVAFGNTAKINADTNGLKGDVGDLTTLKTKDKSSIVNAINEVASGTGGKVKDVQVNGESVLDEESGVANINVASEEDVIGKEGIENFEFNDTTLVLGSIDGSGNFTRSSAYLRTGLLKLTDDSVLSCTAKDGTNIVITMYAYDKDKVFIGYGGGNNTYSVTKMKQAIVGTGKEAVYFAVRLRTTYTYKNITEALSKMDVSSNAKCFVHVKGVKDIAEDYIKSNVLYGKKLVVCGDSFTHGDFGNAPEENYTFADEPFFGENMVYPFFIGRRNNMKVVNEAINGSTIAVVSNKETYPFSAENGRYTWLPNDADYILLNLGINDGGNSVPIGNIDDDDNTTFYGAWNIVLRHILTNYPNARVGIIIPERGTAGYWEAQRLVAKKWGVPYLDCPKDTSIPMSGVGNGKVLEGGATTEAQNILKLRYQVSEINNGHPNQYWHEIESRFVEEFLRKL